MRSSAFLQGLRELYIPGEGKFTRVLAAVYGVIFRFSDFNLSVITVVEI